MGWITRGIYNSPAPAPPQLHHLTLPSLAVLQNDVLQRRCWTASRDDHISEDACLLLNFYTSEKSHCWYGKDAFPSPIHKSSSQLHTHMNTCVYARVGKFLGSLSQSATPDHCWVTSPTPGENVGEAHSSRSLPPAGVWWIKGRAGGKKLSEQLTVICRRYKSQSQLLVWFHDISLSFILRTLCGLFLF